MINIFPHNVKKMMKMIEMKTNYIFSNITVRHYPYMHVAMVTVSSV